MRGSFSKIVLDVNVFANFWKESDKWDGEAKVLLQYQPMGDPTKMIDAYIAFLEMRKITSCIPTVARILGNGNLT